MVGPPTQNELLFIPTPENSDNLLPPQSIEEWFVEPEDLSQNIHPRGFILSKKLSFGPARAKKYEKDDSYFHISPPPSPSYFTSLLEGTGQCGKVVIVKYIPLNINEFFDGERYMYPTGYN